MRRKRPTHRVRRSGRLRALLGLGVLLGLGWQGTFAYWTDSAVVTSGTLDSGSMDLQLDDGAGAVGLGTNFPKGSIKWSGLTPGERKAFSLEVNNVGNPPFHYSATVTRGTSTAWTYTGSPLTVEVHTGSPVPDSSYPQVDSCSGPALGPQQAVDSTSKAVFSSPQPVASGDSQQLCILIGLDATATSANQGKTGSIALTLSAQQDTTS